MTTLVGAFRSYSAWWNYIQLSLKKDDIEAPWADMYDHLEAYYLNNGLYDVLNIAQKRMVQIRSNGTQIIEDMKPLRNPAYRLVEFYAAKLWGGTLPLALPIETENTEIIDPIKQVWKWSNWNVEKQTAARWFANFGDMFIKISVPESQDRVYMQNIKPRYVTDFDTDERGHVTWIRWDIPRSRRTDKGKPETYLHTEVWDVERGQRIWEHRLNNRVRIDQLGDPKESHGLDEYGIDFVPVVWQPFKTHGELRGIGSFTLALDKIDEVNRQATRLHQMLYRYNKATWATVRTGNDPQGRPLPPIRIGTDNTLNNDNDDDTIINLPGASDIKSLVPPINYDSALSVLNGQMTELEKDLPELAYYNLRGTNDLSGKAIRLLLGDAIDRATEARANGEAGLAKAHAMALTIGERLGIFPDVGDYDSGDYDHTFRTRPIIEIPPQERAVTIRELSQAMVPLATSFRIAGYTDEEIAQMQADRDKEDEREREKAEEQLEMQAEMQVKVNSARQGMSEGEDGQPPANSQPPAGQSRAGDE